MIAGNPSRVRVLFVDDDEAFLQMVGQAFADYSKGAWELFLASNTNKALQTLREKSVDLAVLDVQMAGTRGLQFSKTLKREYPSPAEGGVDESDRRPDAGGGPGGGSVVGAGEAGAIGGDGGHLRHAE